MPARITTYHHVTHNISRTGVDAARRFYRDILGLEEIPAVEDPSGQRLIWFALGNQQLHLVIRDTADPASSRHFAAVVDDFDAFMSHLAQNGVQTEQGRRRSSGLRFAFCYDPDGNRIELVESGKMGT